MKLLKVDDVGNEVDLTGQDEVMYVILKLIYRKCNNIPHIEGSGIDLFHDNFKINTDTLVAKARELKSQVDRYINISDTASSVLSIVFSVTGKVFGIDVKFADGYEKTLTLENVIENADYYSHKLYLN